MGKLCEVAGINTTTAAEFIGEIGIDMSRFPASAHLVSWAKFCPKTHESAGKKKAKGRGQGNPWSRRHPRAYRLRLLPDPDLPADQAPPAGPTDGATESRCRLRQRRAYGIWHLLSDPEAHFRDLGPGCYDSRINKDRKLRNLARHLQALTGQTILVRDGKVTVEPEVA
ncbi:transposase [Nonomuraea sp. NPDC005650]|uniref:transposase n=1 Tax=Nonomuraea sp. NPDC005650 TaxID=3157045 RepID=UPI0033B41B78